MHGPNRVPGSLPAVTELASKLAIDASPLLPGTRPIELSYRDVGRGAPIVLLHGGWGYSFYPHDDAIAKLERRFVIPDRTGYGGSPHVTELPPKFHLAAAIETEKLLNALAIERPVLWGHSDGAIIATILALRDPDRYEGIIVEAIHVDRACVSSPPPGEASDDKDVSDRSCLHRGPRVLCWDGGAVQHNACAPQRERDAAAQPREDRRLVQQRPRRFLPRVRRQRIGNLRPELPRRRPAAHREHDRAAGAPRGADADRAHRRLRIAHHNGGRR